MHLLRRVWTVPASLLLVVMLALVPSQTAFAQAPMTVNSVVTDTSHTLSNGDIEQVEQASKQLHDATGSTLYLVIVDTFTTPSDGNDWASAVARQSDFGSADIIFYVGVDTREYGINVDQSLPLPSSTRIAIQDSVRSQVSAGDFAGAAVSAAQQLREALSGSGEHAATETAPSDSQPLTLGLGITVVIILLAIGIIIFLRRTKQRKQLREQHQQAEQQLAQRLQEASSQLVHMDNLIRASEEEMAFASAQFGNDRVAEYHTEITMAKQAAREAFELQGKLLDDIPDDPHDRDTWIDRILTITATASQRLGEQAKHFQELRVRQNDAPKLLQAVREHLAAAHPALAPLAAWTATLAQHYDRGFADRLQDNATQAQQLLELAEDEASSAAASLAAGNPGIAIIDISDAENALAQFNRLLHSLTETKTAVAAAPEQIRAETTQLRRTLAQLQDARNASPMPHEHVTAAISEAQRLLTEVAEPHGLAIPDPLATLSRIHEVSGQLDRLLTQLLDEQQRLAHAQTRLPAAAQEAQTELAAADSLISAKRGAISSKPRTRLDQAEAQFARAEAVRSADPVRSLALYNEAAQLARTALQTAQQEVRRAYSGDWTNWSPGNYGAHRSANTEFWSGLGGAVLGGIIGGILSDSGSSRRHTGGWGEFGGFTGGGGTRDDGFSGGGGTR